MLPHSRRPIEGRSAGALLAVPLSIVFVAAMLIMMRGGICVGCSNQVGLIPVVRRILDPSYLPGDFGIAARVYHHRVYAYLVAGSSVVLGEDGALAALSITSVILVSAALLSLCRTLRLPAYGFVAVGCLLALRVLWAGRGLEANEFVNLDNTPAVFAHALVLWGVAALLQERYWTVAGLAGLTVLIHVQIGLIFALLLFPFCIRHVWGFETKRRVLLGCLFVIPAAPALWHLYEMIRGGLLDVSAFVDYVDFREPHHFALLSSGAAVLTAGHLGLQAAAYAWLRRHQRRDESRKVGVLLVLSVSLAGLALLHFTDYYFIRHGALAAIQFPRMSPFITVFGALSLLTVVAAWDERLRGGGLGWVSPFVSACLITTTAGYAMASLPGRGIHRSFVTHRNAPHVSDWGDVCRWVDVHGPRGTVYLTPPGNEGFTYLANRSNVAEFKIDPDEAPLRSAWLERLRDLAGGTLPRAGGFHNESVLNRGYAALRAEQLIMLGEKYDAELALLPRSSVADFEVLYRNPSYRLVRLRIRNEKTTP